MQPGLTASDVTWNLASKDSPVSAAMPIIDQSLTYAAVGQRLAAETDPRRKAMLEKLYQHSRGEVEEDLEAVMGSLAPDPVYKIQGRGAEMNPRGTAAVRRFYIEEIFAKGRHVLEAVHERIHVCDSSIITEGVIRMVMWGRDLIEQGNPGADDPEAVYLLTYNSLIVWPYDEDGWIVGEESWAHYPADCLRKIDPGEAPERFHAYLAKRRAALAETAGCTPETRNCPTSFPFTAEAKFMPKIRRFYIMPLIDGLDQGQIDELVSGMDACDQFLPGLTDSSAFLDLAGGTVIWENTLASEEMYTGTYMEHPYHACTLDEYLMGDSPRLWTQNTFTVRYLIEDDDPRIERGIRRLMLLNLPEDADMAALEALAAAPAHAASSVLRADTIGWVSAKGRAWTHIWELTFADAASLDRFLATSEGEATASLEGFAGQGVPLNALTHYTYPFDLTGPQGAQPPLEADGTAFYALTARVALGDADRFVALLRECYDPYVVDSGGKLAHRFRTVEGGYQWAEVQSIWELPSVAAYHGFRMNSGGGGFARFVAEAMPMVIGGHRRFSRAI
jgi:hypothetical protein